MSDISHDPAQWETDDKALVKRAEQLWQELQDNELGGYSGVNRPFWISHYLKNVRDGALAAAAKIADGDPENLPCPDHYSGQVAQTAARRIARNIRALMTYTRRKSK